MDQLPLTAEQYLEKCHDLCGTIKFYQKRAEDLFNGKRDECEKELADLIVGCLSPEESKECRDFTYKKGPDGKFYKFSTEKLKLISQPH